MQATKRWSAVYIILIFGALQVFLFGLGYFVRVIRGKTRPAIGEAIVGDEENNAFYNEFKQPWFAPPDWAFAPVWTTNNILSSWGVVRVLNMPEGTPGRDRYLALYAAFALQFVNFNAVYFALESPIGGALLTVGSLIPVTEAMRIAIVDLKDWRVALSLSTLLPWLVIASFTSVTVALWNRDKFFQTPAFIDPPEGWVKKPADKKGKKGDA